MSELKWTQVADWLNSVPVPGGTIYRYGTRHDAKSIVFVPHPAARDAVPAPQQVHPQQQLPVAYTPYHPGPYLTRTSDTAGREVGMW